MDKFAIVFVMNGSDMRDNSERIGQIAEFVKLQFSDSGVKVYAARNETADAIAKIVEGD